MHRVSIAFAIFVWTIAAALLGCGADDDGKTIVIQTRPEDGATADGDAPAREYAEISLCSVTIRFVLERGEGREVQFENGNDTTVIVEIQNQSTGGLVARNCLWADGTDVEPASFGVGDALRATVRQGQGDFWHWTCVGGLDQVLGNFPVCDEADVRVETE